MTGTVNGGTVVVEVVGAVVNEVVDTHESNLPFTHGTHGVPQLHLPRHDATTLLALFS